MLALAATAAPQNNHNLPVLFQFSQPGHNVAVFRGADLKKAIASGLVSGFGNLGASGAEGRDGRSDDDGAGSYSDAAADASIAADASLADPPLPRSPPITTWASPT